MDKELLQLVWERAESTCEYCRLPQKLSLPTFEVDHIIARKHGGTTDESNLALSCFYCNSYKGSNIAGLNQETGKVMQLFHPRREVWHEHFEWLGVMLRGRTAVGKVTVEVLRMNHPEFITTREAFQKEGAFPYR